MATGYGKGGVPVPPPPNHEEAIRRGKLAGAASAIANAHRKSMQKTASAVLQMKACLLDSETVEALKWLKPDMTTQDAIIVAQSIKAISGDTKAAEFIRDTSGQKPKDKVEMSGQVSYESALKKVQGSEF
jgi:hypothetical protein